MNVQDCYEIIYNSFNLFHHLGSDQIEKEATQDRYYLKYANVVFLILQRFGNNIMITAYQGYYGALGGVPVILPIQNANHGPCMHTLRRIEGYYCECYKLFRAQLKIIPDLWCYEETMVSWLDKVPTVSNDHELHYFNITLPELISSWKWKIHEINKCEIRLGLEYNETKNDDYLISIAMAPFDVNGYREVMVDVTWLLDATNTYHNVKWDNAISLVNDLLKGHCNFNNLTFTMWHVLNRITDIMM